MSKPTAAEMRRADFVADVRAMKSEGVARWGDIIIDARHLSPQVEAKAIALTPEEQHRRAIEADRRQREVMFAATSVRPRIPEPASFAHVAPRGMTPTDRDDGAQKQ